MSNFGRLTASENRDNRINTIAAFAPPALAATSPTRRDRNGHATTDRYRSPVWRLVGPCSYFAI